MWPGVVGFPEVVGEIAWVASEVLVSTLTSQDDLESVFERHFRESILADKVHVWVVMFTMPSRVFESLRKLFLIHQLLNVLNIKPVRSAVRDGCGR